MTAHTKGPWSVALDWTGYETHRVHSDYCNEGTLIAECFAVYEGLPKDYNAAPAHAEAKANANVIATAPELLQALETLITEGDTPHTRKGSAVWDQARAVAAKAKGETC